jgi:small-conductance mechanosensitive channel
MFHETTNRFPGKWCPFAALLMISLALCLSLPAVSRAAVPMKMIKAASGQKLQIPEGLPPDKVDGYLAGLSDEQARQVLAYKLKQEAAANTGPAAAKDDQNPTTTFYEMAQGASMVMDQMASFFSGGKSGSMKWDMVVQRLSGGKGAGNLLMTVLIGFALIACGTIVEMLVMRLTDNLRQQILRTVTSGKLQRLGRFISRLFLEAVGVGAYMLTSFVLFIIIFNQEQADYWVVSGMLISSYYFWIFRFTARIIMAPASPAVRLLPLEDRDARFLYRWIVLISLVAAVMVTPGMIIRGIGRNDAMFHLFYIASGLSVTLLMMAMIWQSRHRVAEAVCADSAEGSGMESSLRVRLARSWHFFALLYVAGAGGFWLINAFKGSRGGIVNLLVGLFLIPIFIGIDQWGRRLLKIASGELPEVIDLSGEEKSGTVPQKPEDEKKDIQHFAPLIMRAFRVVLVAFLFFIVLRLWGIDLPVGRIFTRGALGITVALLLGIIVWEFIKAKIDSKLEDEMPADDEEMEEGGAGGSRSVTLLLLLRKFIMAVMFLIVSLMVLSSIGVNIGPLIAGAGVLGLAIGFGAQTLVKDIISGIFFLIDDAFRVGDYIETGGQKGMVEHISLRSLRLRHPRGMVHTIPFGGMGTVTNFSRDYIITKLDFRVRYDTDVEKVRKIIKRINKEISDDPEMGAVMLGKIKSQGVREMDDSAMIMRVKFKTIPGEQFVVRREVYRRLQEQFQTNGIEFAHRNVTVYLPPETTGADSGEGPAGKPDKRMVEAAAGAAIAAAEEEEKK